jgi:arginase
VSSLPRPTLVGVPYDAASSFLRGAADAPPHIRRALELPSSNSWSESIVDLEGAIDDQGDIEIDARNVRASIERGIAEVLVGGGAPIALGGDHSVTYPILAAVRKKHPKLTILHLDAHADLYDEFEGDRYSHACPFARIMEDKLTDRLVQVGIRTLTGHQRDQVRRFGVEVIDMRAWGEGKRPSVEGPIYISLDLDVLDPAFAPGVSHWEPGGLSTRDVISVIQNVRGTLIGADVVEYNPVRDPTGVTSMVAAKLVKELAARMLAGSS